MYAVIYIELQLLHPKNVITSYLRENILTFAHNFSPFIKGSKTLSLIRIFAVTSFSYDIFEMHSLICFVFVFKN